LDNSGKKRETIFTSIKNIVTEKTQCHTSLLLTLSRRNHQAEEWRRGFCPSRLFLKRHLEQDELCHLGA
jgi:hypothetical protein